MKNNERIILYIKLMILSNDSCFSCIVFNFKTHPLSFSQTDIEQNSLQENMNLKKIHRNLIYEIKRKGRKNFETLGPQVVYIANFSFSLLYRP